MLKLAFTLIFTANAGVIKDFISSFIASSTEPGDQYPIDYVHQRIAYLEIRIKWQTITETQKIELDNLKREVDLRKQIDCAYVFEVR